MPEWMVSVDAAVGELSEEQCERVHEELEWLVWDPPLSMQPRLVGSTFTVWAPTRELAGQRGHHLFDAALRLAGVPGDVTAADVSTYEDAEPAQA